MLYLLILLYILTLVYFYDYRKSIRHRNVHYYIVMLLLILVAGFRYRLGVDSIRYEMAFRDLPTLGALSASDFVEQKYDPLYLLMASACRSISEEFWVLQMMQAILVNVVFFRFFKRNTQNIFFAVLIYYLLLFISNMAETMRESCAVAMMLLSYEFYKQDKKISVLFCFILAYLFHSSAIILLFVYIPILFNFDKKLVFSPVLFFVAISILLLASLVQQLFLDNLDLFSFSIRMEDKVDEYSSDGMFKNRLNIFGVLASGLLYGYIPYISSRVQRGRHEYYKLEYFLVVEMICAAMALPIYIFYRYVNFFFPFVIIAICNAISYKQISLGRVGSIKASLLVSGFILMMPYVFVEANRLFSEEWEFGPKTYSRYYPYSSVFSKEIDNDREAIFRSYVY